MKVVVLLSVWLALSWGRGLEGGGGASGSSNEQEFIDDGRAHLLNDALGWMTFRKNGRLMGEAELGPLFLESLITRYSTSPFYRTFVIAFQHGVLPRLKLNENEPCDPAYTLEYKDPRNSSVTWYFQKKFTFESYENRKNHSNSLFCDYRQGLKCHPIERRCLCPKGSSMERISPYNEVKRCLLQEDEVCAVIDIAHGKDPTHSALASNLHHLIFNLEKPLSCKMGTQCRFKEFSPNLPRCYSQGPWSRDSGHVLNLGDECAIGLYADSGTCAAVAPEEDLINRMEVTGVRPGYICYNFGPPRSLPPGTESKIGFCAHEEGAYGLVTFQITNSILLHTTSQPLETLTTFRPLFIAFVHPRTTPLRGAELRSFYNKYLDLVGKIPRFDDAMEENVGRRCSVEKTEKMEAVWKYFASLENRPPSGENYVVRATKDELHSQLDEAISLTINWKKKFCRVYEERRGAFRESLRCVQDGITDSDGNDGRCQKPGNLNTSNFSKKVRRLLETISAANTGQNLEEFRYNNDILLAHLDRVHVPMPPGFSPGENFSPKIPRPLSDGQCHPNISLFRQVQVLHRRVDPDLYKVPFFLRDNRQQRIGRTEEDILLSRVNPPFQKLQNLSSLRQGDKCNYYIETTLRAADETSLTTSKYAKDLPFRGELDFLSYRRVCGRGFKCTKRDKCMSVDLELLRERVCAGIVVLAVVGYGIYRLFF